MNQSGVNKFTSVEALAKACAASLSQVMHTDL